MSTVKQIETWAEISQLLSTAERACISAAILTEKFWPNHSARYADLAEETRALLMDAREHRRSCERAEAQQQS
jgi:hypothetical protein